MPKSWKVEKVNNNIVRNKVVTKFKIGNRKSGKSALLMSNEELEKVLADSNKKRYHNKARAVLASRNK